MRDWPKYKEGVKGIMLLREVERLCKQRLPKLSDDILQMMKAEMEVKFLLVMSETIDLENRFTLNADTLENFQWRKRELQNNEWYIVKIIECIDEEIENRNERKMKAYRERMELESKAASMR
jgi:hypothetical protein